MPMLHTLLISTTKPNENNGRHKFPPKTVINQKQLKRKANYISAK